MANTDGAAPKGVTLTLWRNTADSQALLDLYKQAFYQQAAAKQ